MTVSSAPLRTSVLFRKRSVEFKDERNSLEERSVEVYENFAKNCWENRGKFISRLAKISENTIAWFAILKSILSYGSPESGSVPVSGSVSDDAHQCSAQAVGAMCSVGLNVDWCGCSGDLFWSKICGSIVKGLFGGFGGVTKPTEESIKDSKFIYGLISSFIYSTVHFPEFKSACIFKIIEEFFSNLASGDSRDQLTRMIIKNAIDASADDSMNHPCTSRVLPLIDDHHFSHYDHVNQSSHQASHGRPIFDSLKKAVAIAGFEIWSGASSDSALTILRRSIAEMHACIMAPSHDHVSDMCVLHDENDTSGRASKDSDAVTVMALLKVIRNSLKQIMLHESEWMVDDHKITCDASPMSSPISSVSEISELRRCQTFQDPSVLLRIARASLHSYQFEDIKHTTDVYDVHVSGIDLIAMNVATAICTLGLNPMRNKLNDQSKHRHSSLSLALAGNLDDSCLSVQFVIKGLHILAEHKFELQLLNTLLRPRYIGTNQITILDTQAVVDIDIYPDHRGMVFIGCSLRLGDVTNTCSLSNAGLVTEIFAHAALDWFKEPLTDALEEAIGDALRDVAESQCASFTATQWPSVTRSLGTPLLKNILATMKDHFPKQGFPF